MENRDERLWKMAQKRADFKKRLFTYIVVNVFLWCIWLFTKQNSGGDYSNIPWPIWPTLGWGIGIAFQYFDAYNKAGDSLADKEYEKLKNKQ
jgi:2TM domain